ncbi:SLC13 family permease [Allofustis seminis]|uniref:SLC13 family permease n=1 Tax=Allofustis seminis TaxID=166939 RepID=UPI0003779372|nr:hypothetical protein [Allofustis seminis]
MILGHLNRFQKVMTLLAFSFLLLGGINRWQNLDLLGMGHSTFQLLMLFVASLLLWLFVSIDWPSLLCLLVLGALPEIDFGAVFAQSFGSSTFVFLTLTFALTYTLEQTSALKRITARTLQSHWAQASGKRFILCYLGTLLLMACVMSPTILFMIAFPIYESMVQAFGWQKGDRQAAALLFATYTSIAIGTAMTPINHVFAVTAMGLYEEAYHVSISYHQYMMMGIPAGLLLFLTLIASLYWIWKIDWTTIQSTEVRVARDLPVVTRQEYAAVAIFLFVIVLWLVPEWLASIVPNVSQFFKAAGNAFPPLVGLILMAIISIDGEPVAKVSQVLKDGVFWPSLLLVGAALALGGALTHPEIGLMTIFNSNIGNNLLGLSPWIVVMLFMLWAGLQTNLSSNLVTVTVVGSMAVTLLQSQQDVLNIAGIVCLIGFMSSLAMMTPPAMPYVGIAIGSNWLTSRQAFSYGMWILFWAILIASFVAYPISRAIF